MLISRGLYRHHSIASNRVVLPTPLGPSTPTIPCAAGSISVRTAVLLVVLDLQADQDHAVTSVAI